ncbi:MAG: hypothetical protein IIA67_13725 [Planctomycetes bacterium]|nr:hypothetical protein [Planctomycetota bacterium]
MALIEINYNPSRRELRQFAGIWFPAAAVVVSYWVWQLSDATTAIFVLTAALAAGAGGVARPAWFRYVYIGWMVAAFPIGWTVSHLVLAATYYLLFTPLGLAMRLFGRDPMRRNIDRATSTYWMVRKERSDADRYFRQF